MNKRLLELLLSEIRLKSPERLKREFQATGSPSNPETHARVLKKLRNAGVRSGKEGRTYKSDLTLKQRRELP